MTEFASFDYNTIVTFLARDSIVLDALYAIVRPSVHLSVTRVYQPKNG